jgi:serine/threonine-protein kinase
LTAVCFGYWQFAMLTADVTRILDVPPPPSWSAIAAAAVTPIPQPFYPEGTDVRQAFFLAAALITHFNWFALIVFHGVLVPNTLARGAGVAGGMALLALLISTIAAFVNPATGQHAGTLFTVSGTMLAVGVALSVFGVAKTQALREQVREAREQVRELGQYRLRKRLGAGGMGEVFLAEHRLLKRPCAIKRIHPHYIHHPEQLRRFEREVHATAQLRHPNTVEIYDYGRAEDGTFFYVMEYLPGMSLEELVTRHGTLPADRVVHILRQVCAALRESHRHGLVHRDIKPSNIIVLPFGVAPDQVKLVDFGLVHELNTPPEEGNKITRDGLIVGTPEYMSPEQASGGHLDGRSDLFSLGSVAYYLLTGKEGFNRGNPMKTLLAVVGEEPQPITLFNPYAPPDLCKIINRCLTKFVTDRYQDAMELDSALAACSCAGQWTEQRATEWWERHPEAVTNEGTDLSSITSRSQA